MNNDEILTNVEKLFIRAIFQTKETFKDSFMDLGKMYNFLNKFNENLCNSGIQFTLNNIIKDTIILISENIEGLTILITPNNYEIVISYLPIMN